MEHTRSRHLHFLSLETCAKKQLMVAWRVKGFQTSDKQSIQSVQALGSRSVDIPHTSHFREDTLSCTPFPFEGKHELDLYSGINLGLFFSKTFITDSSPLVQTSISLCQLKQSGYNTDMFFQTLPTRTGLEILLGKSLPFLPLHVSAPHRQTEELFLMHT